MVLFWSTEIRVALPVIFSAPGEIRLNGLKQSESLCSTRGISLSFVLQSASFVHAIMHSSVILV